MQAINRTLSSPISIILQVCFQKWYVIEYWKNAIVWLVWTAQGALIFLALNEDIKMEYSEVCGGFLIYFSLGTICVSYLSIRKRLNNRNRYISTIQNRQILEQNIKLSKTFFTVICASIVCLAPSVSFYIVSCFHPLLFAGFFKISFRNVKSV